MNRFFDWLKDPGTQAVELIVTACAAIGALLLTWYFGKKSLTKKDLTKVEQNTAATSGHLENVHSRLQQVEENTAATSEHLENVHRSLRAQEEREALIATAQRVSITATGYEQVTRPMEMTLILKAEGIVLTRVELYNEVGNLFGSSDCKFAHPLNWKVTLPATDFQRWYVGGTIEQMVTDKRVKLRVFMLIDRQEQHKDFAVHIVFSSPYFTLNGSC